MTRKGDHQMRFAIPVHAGQLSPHFGHSEAFWFADIDTGTRQIMSRETIPAPAHEHGLLPRWLHEHGVNLVIAGGIGANAQRLLSEKGIQVVAGAPSLDPESLLQAYLDQTLVTGSNSCDH